MRVVLANRSSSRRIIAGDAVQQHKTAEALRQLGVTAETAEGQIRSPESVDIVHLFNIIPVEDTYNLFRQAKGSGLLVVLSPIYWNPGEFLEHAYPHRGVSFREWWQKTREQRLELVNRSDLLLPNGQGELECLRRDFGPSAPCLIVPNAADEVFCHGRPDRFRRLFGPNPFVLCVGRVCRRKNQLGLIRALRRERLDLVFVGPVNDYEYYRACRAETTRCKVHFFDAMPPAELASVYAAAEVHVLPSWYETPGLVSLEAALAGCKIVSTDRGTAREYFRGEAWYCDPGDPASIRDAVLSALAHPGHSGLRERIRREYNWERVARLTLSAYQRLLSSSSPPFRS